MTKKLSKKQAKKLAKKRAKKRSKFIKKLEQARWERIYKAYDYLTRSVLGEFILRNAHVQEHVGTDADCDYFDLLIMKLPNGMFSGDYTLNEIAGIQSPEQEERRQPLIR